MSKITIQMGHCFRKTGATGTKREQEFASKLGPLMVEAYTKLGHTVSLIGADDTVPPGDIFIALHCDGSADPNRRGASVGYPSDSDGKLAKAWKAAHQIQGYPGGFLPDNYTANLRGYYGFGRAKGYKHEFLAEHGTTTNVKDESWLFSNLEKCVRAHIDAVGAIVGHPDPVLKPPTQGDKMLKQVKVKDAVTYDLDGQTFSQNTIWIVGEFRRPADETLDLQEMVDMKLLDSNTYPIRLETLNDIPRAPGS